MTQKYTILFDLDGTLVDTAPDLVKAHNHVMKKYGYIIKIKYIMYSISLIILAGIIFYSLDNEFYVKPLERYSTILNSSKSASSLERLKVIDLGMTYVNTNPFIGLGLGNSYLYTKVSVHNPILLSWVENGILGMIGFSSIYLIMLFQGYKLYKNKFNKSIMVLGLVIVMNLMIFGDMFMANSYKRVLWLPALLMITSKKKYAM